MVAAVGDVVSENLARLGARPRLIVYDCASLRRSRGCPRPPEGYRLREARNPAGSLTLEAARAVEDALAARAGRVALRIYGEEDLVALAVLAAAPQGGLVAYGLPGRGMLLVKPCRWVKLLIRYALESMECG